MTEDPLIEAAVSPFADDAELRVNAAGFLQSLRETDPQVEQASIARWTEVDAGRKPRWKLLLWALLALATSLALMASWEKWLAVVQNDNGFVPDPHASNGAVMKRVAARMTAGQRFLVFGIDTKAITAEGRKAVWLSKPDNPSLYASYLHRCLYESNTLPVDLHDVARRIDPENAWFLYLEAARNAESAVAYCKVEVKLSNGELNYTSEPGKVFNPAKLKIAAELIHNAANLRRCDSYNEKFNSELLGFLQWNTTARYSDSHKFFESIQPYSCNLKIDSLADVIGVMSCQAESLGDYFALRSDVDALARNLLDNRSVSSGDVSANRRLVQRIVEFMAAAADRLEIEEDADRWRRIDKKLWKLCDPDVHGNYQIIVDGRRGEFRRINGFFRVNVFGRDLVKNPPKLTDDDLKPGRMLDHDLLCEKLAWMTFVLMGLASAACACHRFRRSRMIRLLALRMGALLKPSDWAWIVGIGVIAPFIYVMAVNRLTPLGGREFGVRGTFFVLPTAHFIGLIVLWLVASPMVVRARLANAAGGFNFKPPHWTAWVVMLSAIAFVPVVGGSVVYGAPEHLLVRNSGLLRFFENETKGSPLLFRVAMGLLALPVGWLVVSSVRALLCRAGGIILQRAVISRAMVPVSACAMGVCILSTFAFTAAEDHWFHIDTPLKVDPSVSGWCRYEHQVAVQMDDELREILENP